MANLGTYATAATEAAIQSQTEAGVVAALAASATTPQPVFPGGLYVVTNRNGEQHVIDTYKWNGADLGRPTRKTGTVEVHNSDAFSWLIAKHGLAETEIYANVRDQSVTAVLNAHGGTDPVLTDGSYAPRTATAYRETPDEDAVSLDSDDRNAGWGDHRVVLRLHKTPAWLAWEAIDRKMLPQEAFAEHVEERLVDFTEPSGAEMLELAQTFQASRGAAFESSHRLADGQTQISYREDTKATAGKAGQLTIPDELALALVPFEGGVRYRVGVRFRYRLNGGHLGVGIVLTRPEDILRAAFLDEVKAIHDKTGRLILDGVAPSRRSSHG